MEHKEKQNISKEIQQNVGGGRNMRALWQRLNERKKPHIAKTKGLRDSNGKVHLDAKSKLRFFYWVLTKNFFRSETPEERAIIPEDIRGVEEEEDAQKYISPEIYQKKEKPPPKYILGN